MAAVDDAGLRVERCGAVASLVIDRPEQRNALTDAVLGDLASTVVELDADPDVRCLVIEGSDKVFASGADIRALQGRTVAELRGGARAGHWELLRHTRTPVVAAVSGLCLGGGCELAMMSDVVIASSTARFGLPETRLGLIPGAGGTQLLTRAVGKATAMDMVLTGRLLDAEEALQAGLVSRVVAADSWRDTARDAAIRIAAGPAVAQRLAKEMVDLAYEIPLSAGIAAERNAFAIAFGSEDAREGLSAFLDKRDPTWRHR